MKLELTMGHALMRSIGEWLTPDTIKQLLGTETTQIR